MSCNTPARDCAGGKLRSEEKPWLDREARPEEVVLDSSTILMIVVVTPPENRDLRVLASESVMLESLEMFGSLIFFPRLPFLFLWIAHQLLSQIVALLLHATASHRYQASASRHDPSRLEIHPPKWHSSETRTNTCVVGLFLLRNCTSHDCTLSHRNVFK
jgi:hypothetical protein